ncbi:hypothetical protein ACFOY4_41745 [Actinomadura syzygii]|uniref:Uncharacterized protein n=1 Tax=Actinomadura syzygii TaxID=1427538 RepID=A0A5D0U4U0_9ACTN|nr:hypothetical protein [Actinomadura syzygii]TYC13087.1 hypothetical protein FXF65_21500 [Actinomadura syzygii]
MTDLSDRYRRLLRWYPRDHRRDHEDEMLGVLLAAARPGQAGPSLRETADLVLGGLRVRVSRTVARASGTGWRDALAVAGVLLPLVLSLTAVRLVISLWQRGLADTPAWLPVWPPVWPSDWSARMIWPVVAVLALAGARRPAALGAVGAIAWWAVIVGGEYARHDATASVLTVWWPMLGLLAVAGLAAGPGPRRGRRILRQDKTLLAATGLFLASTVVIEMLRFAPFLYRYYYDRCEIVAAAVVGVLVLWSPVGRRLAVLLIAPAVSFVLLYQVRGGGTVPNESLTVLFAVLLVSVAVFVVGAVFLGPAERIVRLVRKGGW